MTNAIDINTVRTAEFDWDKYDTSRCYLCCRKLGNKVRHEVHECGGGGLLYPIDGSIDPDECSHTHDYWGDCLGYWSIGSECAKKLPATHVHRV